MSDPNPEAPFATGIIPSNSPALLPFAKVPRYVALWTALWLLPIAIFCGVMALGLIVPLHFWPDLAKAQPALLLIVPLFAFAGWAAFRIPCAFSFAWMRAVMRRDFDRLEPAADDERYVGVAYMLGIGFSGAIRRRIVDI